MYEGLGQERFNTEGQFSGCMRFIRQWEGQRMNGDSGGRLAAGVERDLHVDMQV